MYAQKRRQKKFHDAHVKNKEFKIGDLVLVYTLKQHASKLKKRGNGPYVIHDISTSGAVRLATLDGEQMLNWMSGCRIKKYHETLTPNMLERIHAAKQCKEKAKTVKAEALKESRERAQKCKKLLQTYQEVDTKFPRICQLQSDSETGIELLKPYIRAELGPQRIPQCALVDTGADLNSMSYETWAVLGKPELCASSTRIATYAGDYNQVEGILVLEVFVNDTNLAHKFYVMKPKRMVSPVILGQPWQQIIQLSCQLEERRHSV